MSLSLFLLGIFIPLMVLSGFFLISKMSESDELQLQSFECGYSSYFFSRFSFSIHFFLVGMIFLFLDLELCIIFPFFLSPGFGGALLAGIFYLTLVLLMGLILEWFMGKLEWTD